MRHLLDGIGKSFNDFLKSVGDLVNYFKPGGGAEHADPQRNTLIVNFFQQLSPYLHGSNMITYVFRWIGWSIILLLANLNNLIDQAFTAALKYVDIWQKLGTEYAPYIKPYANFMLLIAIGGMGFLLYRGKFKEATNTPVNIMGVLIIMMMIPAIMPTVFKSVSASQESLTATKGTAADSIVQSNIVDIYTLGKSGWDYKNKTASKGNELKPSEVKYIDINELIKDPKKVEKGDFLDYELSVGTNGKLTWQKMDHGFTLIPNVFEHYYYRFAWHPFVMIFTLLATAVAGLLTLIRFGRIFYSLAVDWIWAPIAAFMHTSSDGMTMAKNVLMSFVSGYITLLALVYGRYIYASAIGLVSSEPNIIARMTLIFGFTWGMLDTPVLLQKAFGIDAGLKSAAGAAVAGLFAANAAKGIGQKGLNAATGVAEAGAFGGGLLKGLASKAPKKPLSEELEQVKKQAQDGAPKLNPQSNPQDDPNKKPQDSPDKRSKDDQNADKQQPADNNSKDNQPKTNDQADANMDEQKAPSENDSSNADNNAPTDIDQSEEPQTPVDNDLASLEASAPPEDGETTTDQQAPTNAPDNSADTSAASNDAAPLENSQSPSNDEATVVGDQTDSSSNDFERNQKAAQSAAEIAKLNNEQAPQSLDQAQKNPLTQAAGRYLETPKADRHASTALGRIKHGYQSGKQIGTDFANYSDVKRQKSAHDLSDKQFLKDFARYAKRNDNNESE